MLLVLNGSVTARTSLLEPTNRPANNDLNSFRDMQVAHIWMMTTLVGIATKLDNTLKNLPIWLFCSKMHQACFGHLLYYFEINIRIV